ncbi:MAG: hypothetical protein HYY28_11315, partial [Betaproteobacteria bacterium]|nr:hypothetical protein [Betaproteobacteria bacterium]
MKRPSASSTTRRETGSPREPAASAQRLALLAFAAAVAVILGAAHFSFKYFSGRVIQNAQENLLAIARLKSAQIGMLIGEKMRDGRM